MTNFIYDNTALPATKSDRNTVTDATRQWAASDANAVFSALTDIRTAVSGTVFNVKAFGAVGNGSTDDTAAIQAAIDAAGAVGGIALIPASLTTYRFSNLKLPSGMRLVGTHQRMCTLERIPGSTGTAIREKTVAEGNPSGAQAIWLENLCIDGNGTAGDAVDLGNQNPGLQFTSQSGISNVMVTDFPSGIGFKLQANAISFYYIWVQFCQIGLKTLGAGANAFHSCWMEECSLYHIQVTDTGNMFFGTQIEDTFSGSNPCIRVESFDNLFSGIFVSLATNKTTIIQNVAGANRNVYRDILLVPNGHTWTDLVRHEGQSVGTGAADFHVSEFVIGENAGQSAWYVNGSTGKVIVRAADKTNNTGSVAIGTTNTPSAPLMVCGSAGVSGITPSTNTVIAAENNAADVLVSLLTSTVKRVAFGNGSGSQDGYIDYDGIARGMRFRCAGSIFMQLSSAGLLTLEQSAVLNNTGGSTEMKRSVKTSNEVVPPQITANQNDYSPTGMSDAAVLLVNSDASRNVTGLATGAAGRWLWMYNAGAQNIVLTHQDALSTATNRIIGRGGANTTLTPNTGAQLYYSPSLSRWVIVTDTL